MTDGSDQGEISLIGAGENQALVAVPEYVDVVGVEQAAHDDLAHLHGAGTCGRMLRRRLAQHGLGDDRGPCPGGVDESARGDDLTMAAVDRHQPPDLAPLGAGAARAGTDCGTARRRIGGGQHHQAGIVDDTVGIFERDTERPLQRIADRMVGDVDGGRTWQLRARGQPVVQ
jgi:hypothetical protein